MSKEIEIEFKSMLTEKEYTKLLIEIGGENPFFLEQQNYYADTADFQLKKQHSALRIRRLPDRNECTLKTPHGHHLMETTFYLTNKEADRMLDENHIIPSSEMMEELDRMAINSNELKFFASLSTRRLEQSHNGHLIVLDKSFYNGTVDYELEIETEEEEKGKEFFHHFLSIHKIPYRKAENKIKRAMNKTLPASSHNDLDEL